jgi:hypothetical protein
MVATDLSAAAPDGKTDWRSSRSSPHGSSFGSINMVDGVGATWLAAVARKRKTLGYGRVIRWRLK